MKTCSFSVTVASLGKSRAAAGPAHRATRESYSYVVIRKGPGRPRATTAAAGVGERETVSSAELLRETAQREWGRRSSPPVQDILQLLGARDGVYDGAQDINSSVTSEHNEWARLVAPPVKHKAHVTLELCTPEGTITTRTIQRSRWRNIPGLYSTARKSAAGGLWPYWPDSNDKP